MFLGDLFGLVLAEVSFETDEELDNFPQAAVRARRRDQRAVVQRRQAVRTDVFRRACRDREALG